MLKRLIKKIKSPAAFSHPETILKKFTVDQDRLILKDDAIPLTYWVNAPNFGDLLSPWLFTKLTGKKTKLVFSDVKGSKKILKKPAYIAIGSILSRVQDKSIVWGSGSFGTEQKGQISKEAQYHAVRGPLTRCLVNNVGAKCPDVYGDPALLIPLVYNPDVKKEYEIGVVLRWSEKKWLTEAEVGPGVKIIDLGTDDVEGVLKEMKRCKRILTSSLHGLIIADAYGIPNAWLSSRTPKGGEFKFYDYFLSVDKVRSSKRYDVVKRGLAQEPLLAHFEFDGRSIKFDYEKLLDACPFLKRVQ